MILVGLLVIKVLVLLYYKNYTNFCMWYIAAGFNIQSLFLLLKFCNFAVNQFTHLYYVCGFSRKFGKSNFAEFIFEN